MLNHNRAIDLAIRPFNLLDRFFNVDEIRILRKNIKELNNKLNSFIEQIETTDDANS